MENKISLCVAESQSGRRKVPSPVFSHRVGGAELKRSWFRCLRLAAASLTHGLLWFPE